MAKKSTNPTIATTTEMATGMTNITIIQVKVMRMLSRAETVRTNRGTAQPQLPGSRLMQGNRDDQGRWGSSTTERARPQTTANKMSRNRTAEDQ